MQTNIHLTNGSIINGIFSDTTWKASYSPITYDSLYNGEHYDATLE